jgi:hypothetical protein
MGDTSQSEALESRHCHHIKTTISLRNIFPRSSFPAVDRIIRTHRHVRACRAGPRIEQSSSKEGKQRQGCHLHCLATPLSLPTPTQNCFRATHGQFWQPRAVAVMARSDSRIHRACQCIGIGHCSRLKLEATAQDENASSPIRNINGLSEGPPSTRRGMKAST